MRENKEVVLVIGAGPVGLVTTAALISSGIPVKLIESSAVLELDLRASTFHPPTLDFLETLGIAETLVKQGLICRQWQFRDRNQGIIASFDLTFFKLQMLLLPRLNIVMRKVSYSFDHFRHYFSFYNGIKFVTVEMHL